MTHQEYYHKVVVDFFREKTALILYVSLLIFTCTVLNLFENKALDMYITAIYAILLLIYIEMNKWLLYNLLLVFSRMKQNKQITKDWQQLDSMQRRLLVNECFRGLLSCIWIILLNSIFPSVNSSVHLWNILFFALEPLLIELFIEKEHRITFVYMITFVLVQAVIMIVYGLPFTTCAASCLIYAVVAVLSCSIALFLKSMNSNNDPHLQHEQSREKETYEMLYKSAPNPLFSVSATNHVIMDCNASASELIGLEMNELCNSNFLELFQDDCRSKVKELLTNQSGSNISYSPLHLKKTTDMYQGESIENVHVIVSLSATVVCHSDKEPVSFNIVLNNITESTIAMQKMTQEMENAVKANNAKSNFLAVMSHELKTPLNAVLGMTDLMIRTTLDSEQEDYVMTISYSSKVLLSLVQGILDFSKIEAAKVELEERPFDLYLSLDQIARGILQPQARRKGLDFRLEIDNNVQRYISGDENRLNQIILNLCNNAIKFTCKGEVVVSVHNDSTEPILSNEKARIRVVVSDTGIGIPANKIENLFGKFYQLDPSTTRKYGGSGLGLAISKQLIQLMNGRIWVESCEGIGSKFTFTAEFNKSSKLQVERRQSDGTFHKNVDFFEAKDFYDDSLGNDMHYQVQLNSSNVSILVVDDNKINLKVICKILNHLGYKNIKVACNGQEAIDMYKNAYFNIVFLDLCMPVCDGFKACRTIREYEKEMQIPRSLIIALTANAIQGVVEQCKDAGFNFFLTKPTTIRDMQQTMEHFVGPCSPANELDAITQAH
jgi:signal transduction histidine kinase/CheY-like chemotaxis protein